MASTWTASTSLSVGDIIAPTSQATGLFFKVTVAGTTGSSEPNWVTSIGEIVYDNNVRYLSFSATFSDLQPINPSAIIELFTLTLNHELHYEAWENNRSYKLGDIVRSANTNKTIVFKCTTAGTSGGSEPAGFASATSGGTVNDSGVVWTAQDIDVYRFHSGSNMNANGQIVWQGKSYLRFPILVSGFAFQNGQLPRPKLVVSNALGTISAILLSVNQATVGNDLTGATVKRIRTLAKFLDNANFAPVTTTSTTTQTVVDPADVESITYTVTVVQDSNGDNVFAINGVQKPVLTMKRGSTYQFNQSHSSNIGHPLRIKSDAGGQQTTTNVGTLGTDAIVTYQPAYPSAPNDLRYYCESHGNNMGNTITMNNPNTIQQQATSTSTSTGNPYGTADPTAEFPQEIYSIDRKATETREVVEFELASVLDLVGISCPKRQCTRSDFPSIGTFVG